MAYLINVNFNSMQEQETTPQQKQQPPPLSHQSPLNHKMILSRLSKEFGIPLPVIRGVVAKYFGTGDMIGLKHHLSQQRECVITGLGSFKANSLGRSKLSLRTHNLRLSYNRKKKLRHRRKRAEKKLNAK